MVWKESGDPSYLPIPCPPDCHSCCWPLGIRGLCLPALEKVMPGCLCCRSQSSVWTCSLHLNVAPKVRHEGSLSYNHSSPCTLVTVHSDLTPSVWKSSVAIANAFVSVYLLPRRSVFGVSVAGSSFVKIMMTWWELEYLTESCFPVHSYITASSSRHMCAWPTVFWNSVNSCFPAMGV